MVLELQIKRWKSGRESVELNSNVNSRQKVRGTGIPKPVACVTL